MHDLGDLDPKGSEKRHADRLADGILTVRLAFATGEITDEDLYTAFLHHSLGNTAKSLVESLRASIVRDRPRVAVAIAIAEHAVVTFVAAMLSRVADRDLETLFESLKRGPVPHDELRRVLNMLRVHRPRLAARLTTRFASPKRA